MTNKYTDKNRSVVCVCLINQDFKNKNLIKEVVKVHLNYYKTYWLIVITAMLKNKLNVLICGCMKLIFNKKNNIHQI